MHMLGSCMSVFFEGLHVTGVMHALTRINNLLLTASTDCVDLAIMFHMSASNSGSPLVNAHLQFNSLLHILL